MLTEVRKFAPFLGPLRGEEGVNGPFFIFHEIRVPISVILTPFLTPLLSALKHFLVFPSDFYSPGLFLFVHVVTSLVSIHGLLCRAMDSVNIVVQIFFVFIGTGTRKVLSHKHPASHIRHYIDESEKNWRSCIFRSALLSRVIMPVGLSVQVLRISASAD